MPIGFLRTNEPASVGFDSTSSVDLFRAAIPSVTVDSSVSIFETIFLKQLESEFSSEQPHKKSGIDGLIANENPITGPAKRPSDADNNLLTFNPLLSTVVFEPRKPVIPSIELIANAFVDANRNQPAETTGQSDEQGASSSLSNTTVRGHQTVATGERSESKFDTAMVEHGDAANSASSVDSAVLPSALSVSQMAAAAKLMTMSSLGLIPKAADSADRIPSSVTTNVDSNPDHRAGINSTSESGSLTSSDVALKEELDSVQLQTVVQRSNQRQYEAADLDGVLVSASELVPFTKDSRKSLADDLSSAIRDQLDSESLEGPTTIHFQLERPDLGVIKVQLSIANKVVAIRITTENPSSRQIVTQAMGELRQALTVGGLICGQFQIESAVTDRSMSSAAGSRSWKPAAVSSMPAESSDVSDVPRSTASRGFNFVA